MILLPSWVYLLWCHQSFELDAKFIGASCFRNSHEAADVIITSQMSLRPYRDVLKSLTALTANQLCNNRF